MGISSKRIYISFPLEATWWLIQLSAHITIYKDLGLSTQCSPYGGSYMSSKTMLQVSLLSLFLSLPLIKIKKHEKKDNEEAWSLGMVKSIECQQQHWYKK